jgi:hypothetical protein
LTLALPPSAPIPDNNNHYLESISSEPDDEDIGESYHENWNHFDDDPTADSFSMMVGDKH